MSNTELLKLDLLISIAQFSWSQRFMNDFLKLHWFTLIVTPLSVDNIFLPTFAFDRKVDFVRSIIKERVFSITQSFMKTFAFILLVKLNWRRVFWKIVLVRVTLILLALIDNRQLMLLTPIVGLTCKVTAVKVNFFLILKKDLTDLLGFMEIIAFWLELLELKISSLCINNVLFKLYSYCCSWPPSIRIVSEEFDISTACLTVLHGAIQDPQFGWSLPMLPWVTCMIFAIVPERKKISD